MSTTLRTKLVLKTVSATGLSMDLSYRKGADLTSVVGDIIKLYPVDLARVAKAIDAKLKEQQS